MKIEKLIKLSGPHILSLIIFVGLSIVYFYPQLQGRVMQQADNLQFKGMSKEIHDHRAATGEETLWTNAMFGGMPTYQIHLTQPNNLLKWPLRMSRMFFGRPIGLFIAAMISFYILMICLGVGPWVSAMGSIAFAFGTNNLIMYEAGHFTKLGAISYLPLIAAGLILTYRSKLILGGLIFALGLGMDIYINHVQMTYYFFLTIPFFVLPLFINSIKEKRLRSFFKSTGVLVIAGLLAIGTSTGHLWTTYEYSKDTMRGAPILTIATDDRESKSSSEVEGLDFEYATAWSNGWLDLFGSFIPGVAGGGSAEPVGKKSETYKFLRNRSTNSKGDVKAPLYWGSLPFTSGPIYFGAITLFLFLIGTILEKGPIKWWALGGLLLTLMISLGNNFPLYRILHDNFPLFNKFRTPNSVLSVTITLLPLLGFYILSQIISNKHSKNSVLKSVYISIGIYGLIALFFLFVGPFIFNFVGDGDTRYSDSGWDTSVFVKDRISLMRGDSLRILVIIFLSGGLIWAYAKDKIKKPYLLCGLSVLMIYDLFSVGKRYVNHDDFVNKKEYANNFVPRPVDTQILQDNDPNYRVLDVTVNTYNSASTSYFHKTIGGYHAAKLQRYQDIIDRHLLKGNQKVLDMLNAKYIIGGKVGEEISQQIPTALGNVWLIDSFALVADANSEIDALNSIDPRTTAAVHQEYAEYLPDNVDGLGSIALTSYAPNHITYMSNTYTDQFAVYSEIWYDPNKGWQAYIDGEKSEHIRVNYILRGMNIPSGEHSIEFKFEPKAYNVGKNITLVFSGLLIFLLLGYFGRSVYYYSAKKRKIQESDLPKKIVKKRIKSTKFKRKKTK